MQLRRWLDIFWTNCVECKNSLNLSKFAILSFKRHYKKVIQNGKTETSSNSQDRSLQSCKMLIIILLQKFLPHFPVLLKSSGLHGSNIRSKQSTMDSGHCRLQLKRQIYKYLISIPIEERIWLNMFLTVLPSGQTPGVT